MARPSLKEMNDIIRPMYLRRDPTKLSDQVVLDLQQKIVSGELKVGARLPTEAELCGMFKVSRTVIRDALRTLAAMGLVSVEHGTGISVTQPNDRSAGAAMGILLLRSGLTIGDVLDARSAIEPELCALAARYATDEDIARIAGHLAAFRAATMSGNTDEAFTEHLHFHAALYEAIRIPAVALLLRPMVEAILLSSFPPRVDDPALWEVDAHERVLQALRARDEQRLKHSLRAHFREMETPAYSQHRQTPLCDSSAVRNLMERLNEMFGRPRKGADTWSLPRAAGAARTLS
jgi:DNA-binding FadR family transcriptional regulator